MNRLGFGFLASLALLFSMSSSVLARDVCLQDDFGDTYIFNKVPRLRPGAAIPLTGVELLGTSAAPLEGSAFLNTAGTQGRFGIFVHTLVTGAGGNNFTVEWNGDATFAGTGFFDASGSFTSDGPLTFNLVDCSTVVVP